MIGKKFTNTASIAALCLSLSGCFTVSEVREVEERYDSTQTKIQPLADTLPKASKPETSSVAVHVRGRPWLGLEKLPEIKGKPLDEHLLIANGVTIPFEKELTPGELASRIFAATNITVVFDGSLPTTMKDVVEDNPFRPVTTMPQTTPEGVVWSGSLDTLLDQWTAWHGFDWIFDGQRIVVQRNTSSVFVVNALAGTKSFETSLASDAQTEDSTSLARQSLTTSHSFDIWGDIEKQIQSLLTEGSKIGISPVNGTITVTGLPGDIDKVRSYLEYQNNEILRPVVVSARILNIKRDRNADYNVDLNFLIEDVLGKQALRFESNPTDNIIGLIRPSNVTSNTVNATIKALSSIGTVSRELDTSASTINGQPVAFHDIVQQSYVARTTTSATDGATSTAITPGTVASGYFFSVLPRVVGEDNVLVRVKIGVQDLLNLREIVTADTTIQLPEQASRAITIEQAIRTGETLILSGATDRNNTSNSAGFGNPSNWFLGGGQDGRLRDGEQIILLTAQVSAPLGIREYKGKSL